MIHSWQNVAIRVRATCGNYKLLTLCPIPNLEHCFGKGRSISSSSTDAANTGWMVGFEDDSVILVDQVPYSLGLAYKD
jgi:hypothetical protein